MGTKKLWLVLALGLVLVAAFLVVNQKLRQGEDVPEA